VTPIETLRQAVYVWRCDVCSASELEEETQPLGWSQIGLESGSPGQPYRPGPPYHRGRLLLCPKCQRMPLDCLIEKLPHG
jgi:hypothetical protein